MLPHFLRPDLGAVNWRDWRTWILVVPVTIVYVFYKSAESLRNKVSAQVGLGGVVLHEVLAVVAAAGAAISAYSSPDQLPFHAWLGGTGEAILAFLVTWAYIFPGLWLTLLKPAYDLLKWCWRHLDIFTKNIVSPLLKATPKKLAWLPGASKIWAAMGNTRFLALTGFIVCATAAGAALYLGWVTKSFVEHEFSFAALLYHEPAVIAAWAAGAFVAFVVGRIMVFAIIESENEGLATILGAAATYAAHGWLDKISADFRVWNVIPWAITYIVTAVYGLPLLNAVFTAGFWGRLWKKIEPTVVSFLKGTETPFRHVFLQTFGIMLALMVTGASSWLCTQLGLNLLVVPVSMFATFVAYLIFCEVLDRRSGNMIADFIISGAVAAGGGLMYVQHGLLFGVYGAIASGCANFLLTFFVVVPLEYAALERLVGGFDITIDLGIFLPGLHKTAVEQIAEPVLNKCVSVYNDGYGHEPENAEKYKPFRTLVWHTTNGIIAWFAASTAWAGLEQLPLLHGLEPWVGYAAIVVVALVSLALAGRLINKRSSLEIPGLLTSLWLGLKAGALVLTAQTLGIYFALPFGAAVIVLSYSVLFPLACIGTRPFLNPIAPFVLKVLDRTYDLAWRFTRGFWETFTKLFSFLYDLLDPLWKFLGRWWNKFAGAVAAAWRVVSGLLAPAWRLCASALEASRAIWQSIFGGAK